MKESWKDPTPEIAEDAAAALHLGLEALREYANRTAPIEEKILIGSSGTDVDRARLRGSVFYDTKYARRQHEELTWQHDPGRRAKWLELSVREFGPQVFVYVGQEIRRRQEARR